MRLGLYSALGRQDIAAVRQFVAARGYTGDAASIRQCRQELMGFAPGTPQRIVAETSDFFSTSECRDLLFHVQEHNLTLPQIADFLAANALTFLGFEGCATGYQRYAQLFPDDAAMADLGRWARIETESPRAVRQHVPILDSKAALICTGAAHFSLSLSRIDGCDAAAPRCSNR